MAALFSIPVGFPMASREPRRTFARWKRKAEIRFSRFVADQR